MVRFNGFPEDLFLFLDELAVNNNREWFNENKDRYQQSIVEPVTEFICAIGERLDGISENFVADTRKNGGSMFRIYRDVRFSRNKRPYKENVGCHFRHVAGNNAHAPCFYLHLQPGNVFVGAGIWKPPGPELDKIRTRIVEHPDDWQAVVNNTKLVKRFGGVEGESLIRPPRGYDADNPYIEDLKLKTFFLQQYLDDSFTQTPKFINEVVRAYSDSAPLMRFITNATGLPF